MKKIIIAILLVFSCGILALTIPKRTSAAVITNDDYDIELSKYDGVNTTTRIETKETLIFGDSISTDTLYLTYIDIEYYCYVNYGFGLNSGPKYLFCEITGIYVAVSHYLYNVYQDVYLLPLDAPQGETLVFNLGITDEEFENIERSLDNLFVNGLSLNLNLTYSEYPIIDITCGLLLQYNELENTTYNYYYYEWDLVGDSQLDLTFEENEFFVCNYHNIVPPNLQAYINRYHIISYARENTVIIQQPVYIDGNTNFLGFIQNATNGFFETELIGNISIADILLFIISVALLIFLLRFFAGG